MNTNQSLSRHPLATVVLPIILILLGAALLAAAISVLFSCSARAPDGTQHVALPGILSDGTDAGSTRKAGSSTLDSDGMTEDGYTERTLLPATTTTQGVAVIQVVWRLGDIGKKQAEVLAHWLTTEEHGHHRSIVSFSAETIPRSIKFSEYVILVVYHLQ